MQNTYKYVILMVTHHLVNMLMMKIPKYSTIPYMKKLFIINWLL
jgi:hypothetical protein